MKKIYQYYYNNKKNYNSMFDIIKNINYYFMIYDIKKIKQIKSK